MARPRTPTAVLKAKGAYIKHPERKRERAAEPVDLRPLGDPPEDLQPDQLRAWLEVVDMAVAGVLTHADRGTVELAARSLASLRERFLDVPTKDGVVTINKPFDSKAAAALMRCLVEMGLTPVSRSKVQVVKDDKQPASGFDALN